MSWISFCLLRVRATTQGGTCGTNGREKRVPLSCLSLFQKWLLSSVIYVPNRRQAEPRDVIRPIALRRKSRLTCLESMNLGNGLSSLWVGHWPMGTQNLVQG